MYGPDLVITTSVTHNLSLVPGSPNEFIVTGSPTLTGGVVIQLNPAETPAKWDCFRLIWNAVVTLNGNTCTVFGTTLTQEEAANDSEMFIIYDGSAWIVVIGMDYSDLPLGVNGTYTHTMNTGENITFDPAVRPQNLVITGSPVMVGSSTYNGGGSPIDGNRFFIWYKGTPTTGGVHSVTIFGTTLTDLQAISGNVFAVSVYNGASWVTQILFSDTYRIMASSGDTAPGYLDAKVKNSIEVDSNQAQLVNDSAAPGAYKMYGTSSAGTKGWYDQNNYLSADVQIDHADILTLNGTPIQLVANPGVGKAIEEICTSISIVGIVGVVTPYATNTLIEIYTDTATTPQSNNNTILVSTVDRVMNCAKATTAAATTDTKIIANKGLYAMVNTGNPTGGLAGQYIKIKVLYRIIDVP